MSVLDTYRVGQLPVPGGPLAVGAWGSGKPVLAIHGISSTHKLWLWTAAHLDGVRLIAPDLRGRGASQGLPKEYGLARHRDDLLAILDHLGIERLTVVGMSLGGFIAMALAAAHPERVERLVLVDGGIPFANAAALKQQSREQVHEALKDRFQRLERKWASLDQYRGFFVGATAPLLDQADPLLEEYLRYDLVGAEPELAVRLDLQALADDSVDLFHSDDAERAAAALKVPAKLFYAEWTAGRDSPPAYPKEYLAGWLNRLPSLEAEFLPGTDHAATAMTDSSGRKIAAAVSGGS